MRTRSWLPTEAVLISLERRIDEACDRFEDAWAAGRRPPIEGFLSAAGDSQRTPLLRELILLEIHYRRQAGEDPHPTDYCERFPTLDAAWLEESCRAPPPRRAPGTLPELPDYEILDELGRGGMGIVYRARQLSLDRLVALKMIRGGAHAGPEEVARFQSEAEAVARLHHPNFVQIHEIGTHDGLPYLALELVSGASLARHMNGTPRPPDESAHLVQTLARAIQFAHEHGIVHRDLKPANVLLSFSREPPASAPPALAEGSRLNDAIPKITDFGLAKKLDDSIGQTATGAIVGTPSYMAPEQAAGSRAVGPGTDVYALGTILYEMLTGRPPFQGASMLETLEQVRAHEAVPPRRLQPRVPRDLETICLKCLQKEPHKRYGSAADLANDLGRFEAGRPILARPVGPVERLILWGRRRPATAALLLVSALAVLSLVGVGVAQSYNVALQETNSRLEDALDLTARAKQAEKTQREKTEQALKGEAEQRGLTQSALQTADRFLYLNRVLLADSALRDFDGARAEPLLDACPPALRHWEWHYLKGQLHPEILVVQLSTRTAHAVALSRDGRRLATTAGHQVRIWDAETGKPALFFSPTGKLVRTVAFSPDGRRIALGGWDNNVTICDSATGRQIHCLRGHKQSIWSVAYSPDGHLLASAASDMTIRLWDPETGRERGTLTGHTYSVCAVAFSPDGSQLVSGGADNLVKLWDVKTRQVIRTFQGHTRGCMSVAVGQGGRVASGSHDRMVRIWDTATGRKHLLLPCRQIVFGVAFSPDGRWLASGGGTMVDRLYPAELKIWDTNDGSELYSLTGHAASIHGLVFRSDGSRLVTCSGDGTARVWPVTGSGPGKYQLDAGADKFIGASFSRDGRLVVGDRSGAVGVWNSERGPPALVMLLAPRGRSQTCFAATSDGRHFAFGQPDGVAEIWTVPAGAAGGRPTLFAALRAHAGPVQQLVFSADGKRLASRADDGSVRVWELETIQRPTHLPGRGPKPLFELPGAGRLSSFSGIHFSPDGTLLVKDNLYRVRGWDVGRDREMPVVTGADSVGGIAFSADGARMATGLPNGRVSVWELRTGRELSRLIGVSGATSSVAFSPDGRRLATCNLGIKIWDLETTTEALTVAPVLVSSVTFSPNGRYLVSHELFQSSRILIWDAGANACVHPADRPRSGN
jgi:WD40 repeat protein/serine/threonine protein kinase